MNSGFTVEFFGGGFGIYGGHQFMPPVIAAGFHVNWAAGPPTTTRCD
jgi:hypothetical protein